MNPTLELVLAGLGTWLLAGCVIAGVFISARALVTRTARRKHRAT